MGCECAEMLPLSIIRQTRYSCSRHGWSACKFLNGGHGGVKMDQDVKKDESVLAERFDVEAVNPRYKGAKMSDLVRALFVPRGSEARATLKKLWADVERI